jgi:flap endonuclease-1
MGLQIGNIVPRKPIEFLELKNKKIAVDAFNTIYQFLSTIRQPDGTPLQDKKGNITSHLSGLFYRNINLMKYGFKLIYVFDGKTPRLKKTTNEKRKEQKDIAFEKYQKAKKQQDTESMKKYSQQLSSLDEQKIQESKELLEAMGICVIQAPGEGEAQAAYLAKHKDIYCVASQDYDSLLFGAPTLVQNLTLARKRKTASGYVSVNPEKLQLQRVLNNLQINHEQLICLGILAGTDYNPGGVKGIGPKRALDLVRQKKAPALIFKDIPNLNFNWQEVFSLFKNPDIKEISEQEIKFLKINQDKIRKILLDRDFSEDRIDSALEKLNKAKDEQKQQTLF